MSKFPPSKKPINPVVKGALKRTWSEYQKDIFKDIARGIGHTVIEAYAGSGKSTTIIESFKYVPRGKKILALAFNKKIQEDLREKSPSYVDCLTFHSLGLRAIKKRFQNVQIDEYKMINILKELLGSDENFDVITSYCDTIAYCKYSLTDTPSQIDYLIDKMGVDLMEIPRKEYISNVIQALGMCKKQTNIIDFNDMCYFPFIYNLPLDQYDFVYLDEFQDTNKSQVFMAKKSLKTGTGRLIAAGDFYQDLYSWRLSDPSMIRDLLKESDAKTLVLPVSYRCPKKVIEMSQRYVKDITCPDTAIEGEIIDINVNKMMDIVQPGDFILSRVNAPLIKLCMALIKKGKKANIKGRDVGKNLQALIKKSQKKKVKDFIPWLDDWFKEQLEILQNKNIPTENLYDKHECLMNLCEDLSDMKDVSDKIQNLFSDDSGKGIIELSSVHRSKGLETKNVFCLKYTFRGWLDGTDEDDPTYNEELNIFYVAITRSQKNLYIVKK